MDSVKLGQNLIWVGAAFLVGALVWWFASSSGLPGDDGSLLCIAGMGLECHVVNLMSGYSAAPFWIGLVLLIAGFVIRRSAKKPQG